ncbi:thioredoxin family protein [Candidatus Saccharibacteria bacterium]|nr:thioredoxin family protein [Candidatus Saccharibacteria bacterium]
MTKKDDIIEFYGETCPHCLSMKPVIDKIEKDKDIQITRLEVWNNTDNQEKMHKYEEIIGEACGGFAAVPAFVNTKTNQALCGAHDEADIIALINGDDCTGNVCMPHTKMSDKK